MSKGAELHEEANRQSGAQVKCLCTKAHIMSYKREELAAIGTWWDEHCWDAEVDGCKPSCYGERVGVGYQDLLLVGIT